MLLCNRIVTSLILTLLTANLVLSQDAQAAEVAAPDAVAIDAAPDAEGVDADMAKRHAAFEEKLSGSSLVGRFTTKSGDDDGKELKEERYDITSVKKMKNGDYWIIKTRIRYGKRDLTVPVPVEVKWAGDVAVIQLNNVPVPGLGTFDSHVLINGDQYAGTWRHDKVGGHLFGRIEKTEEALAE